MHEPAGRDTGTGISRPKRRPLRPCAAGCELLASSLFSLQDRSMRCSIVQLYLYLLYHQFIILRIWMWLRPTHVVVSRLSWHFSITTTACQRHGDDGLADHACNRFPGVIPSSVRCSNRRNRSIDPTPRCIACRPRNDRCGPRFR